MVESFNVISSRRPSGITKVQMSDVQTIVSKRYPYLRSVASDYNARAISSQATILPRGRKFRERTRYFFHFRP